MRQDAGWLATILATMTAFTLMPPASSFGQAGLPTIEAQPSSLSVVSGATASFMVTAAGTPPLGYQWLFNGTNLSSATGATLTISNVQSRHWGAYSVVVSNSVGMVTSQVAQLTVDADLVFRVLSLQTNAAIAIEHNQITGDDRGGIAVSGTSVFVTGDGNSGSNFDPVTARFPIDTLTGGTSLGRGYDALVSNLRTETVYSLGNGSTLVQYTDFNLTPTTVNSLIEINGTTGQPTGQRINLSAGIPISSSSGIFAGWDRVVIYNGSSQRIYNIALPSGEVSDMGNVGFLSRQSSESWAFWGVAEYFGGAIHLLYVQSSVSSGNLFGTAVVRVRIPDLSTVPVLGPFSSSGIADMASLTFSPSRSRWFFHHEGTSIFRSGDETVGSAKASFTTDVGFPSIVVEPIDQVSYPSSNVTFRVTASGSEPLSYQWRFNENPIPGATGPVVTLTDIGTNAMGLYSVEVGNSAGGAISRSAQLTVYSVPQIVLQPQSRSVFPGTNTTFTLAINAAPPVTYQWRFGGMSLTGATNSFLLLTNIQPGQAGLYSVLVSNRFGIVTSSNAELNVVVPSDDGSVFQITSLTSNGANITDAYQTLDFNYGYGPLAVSSSRVFYSSFDTTAHSSANDLSGGVLNSRRYTAICSDLRTETVYALGTTVGPFTNYGASTLTSLWEVNGANGTLTGNRISLSVPIGPVSQNSGNVGFFAGYERMILLANSRAYNIALPSGFVSDLGPMQIPSFHAFSFGNAFWGVAEHSGGVDYLVYARNDGQNIVRTRVPDGVTTNFVAIPGLSSYMSSISASVPRGRWYFHYLFDSQAFGDGNATVGYATATFTNNPGFKAVSLEWSPIGEVQAVNTPIPVTIVARTATGEVATNYNRQTAIAGFSESPATSIPISPTNTSAFVNGVWTGQITVSQLSTGMVLRAVDFLGVTGTSSVFSVNAPNDLVLTVRDGPDPVPTGQRLTYTLNAYNIGPNPATAVTLSNLLASGVTFVSATSSQGSCSVEGRSIHCAIGAMTAGANVTVSVAIDVGLPGTITNYATLRRGEGDASLANNFVESLTTVTPPSLFIDDATIVEGDSGTNDLIFTVHLFPPTTNLVTVNFTTLNNSASSSGLAPDYVAGFGSLTFPPGTTNQNIIVRVRGDVFYEINETFFVLLTSPGNASLIDNQATGTILNDDPLPFVSVADVTVTEGNAGITSAIFQVKLSTNTGVSVSIPFATVADSARDGSDFIGTNGIMTIPAGTTILTRNLVVPVRGDTLVESNESFRLVFSVTNAIPLNTQAVCTILADDGLGLVHRFGWSSVPSPQQIATPIPVTITALDPLNEIATNFNGTVSFTGRSGPAPSDILGDAEFENSGTGDFTIGYAFVPKSDLTVTHFRHYAGTKVSLWTGAGTLLAALPVDSIDGQWQETPLLSPVQLTAGTTYLLGYYTGEGDYYFRGDTTTNFADVTLTAGYFAIQDSFPNQEAGLVGWSVDIRYVLTDQVQDVAVSPTSSGNFVNGIWSGEISIQTATTNVVITAVDNNQHSGNSTPFDVLLNLGADLAINLVASPNPVSIGSNLTYAITVTNLGPNAANAVIVTDNLPGSLTLLSATTTAGFATNIGNLVAVDLGTLSNRASASITITVRPNSAGSFNNVTVVTSGTFDPATANNQSARGITVYRDTDGDGIWDIWESAHGLDINDPADAGLDSDGDLHTNWQEFIAGTNPKDSNSVTRLLALEIAPAGPRLTLQGSLGKTYRLDRNEGPTDDWIPVMTFEIGASGDSNIVVQVVDPQPVSHSTRLYRIQIVQ